MDAEEGAGVLVGELHGGVCRRHVRRHQRRVRPRLDDEVLERDALPKPQNSVVSLLCFSRSKPQNDEFDRQRLGQEVAQYLHGDLGLLGAAGAPEHEGEEGEEDDEAADEDEAVLAALGHGAPLVLVVQEPFFLDDPDLLPPFARRRPLAARRLVLVVAAGEAAGGGVPADGGVRVARRRHGAQRRRRVHGRRRLGLTVVRVPRRALHVVHRAPHHAAAGVVAAAVVVGGGAVGSSWRARRRRRRQARHLRVRLGVHLGKGLCFLSCSALLKRVSRGRREELPCA